METSLAIATNDRIFDDLEPAPDSPRRFHPPVEPTVMGRLAARLGIPVLSTECKVLAGIATDRGTVTGEIPDRWQPNRRDIIRDLSGLPLESLSRLVSSLNLESQLSDVATLQAECRTSLETQPSQCAELISAGPSSAIDTLIQTLMSDERRFGIEEGLIFKLERRIVALLLPGLHKLAEVPASGLSDKEKEYWLNTGRYTWLGWKRSRVPVEHAKPHFQLHLFHRYPQGSAPDAVLWICGPTFELLIDGQDSDFDKRLHELKDEASKKRAVRWSWTGNEPGTGVGFANTIATRLTRKLLRNQCQCWQHAHRMGKSPTRSNDASELARACASMADLVDAQTAVVPLARQACGFQFPEWTDVVSLIQDMAFPEQDKLAFRLTIVWQALLPGQKVRVLSILRDSDQLDAESRSHMMRGRHDEAFASLSVEVRQYAIQAIGWDTPARFQEACETFWKYNPSTWRDFSAKKEVVQAWQTLTKTRLSAALNLYDHAFSKLTQSQTDWRRHISQKKGSDKVIGCFEEHSFAAWRLPEELDFRLCRMLWNNDLPVGRSAMNNEARKGMVIPDTTISVITNPHDGGHEFRLNVHRVAKCGCCGQLVHPNDTCLCTETNEASACGRPECLHVPVAITAGFWYFVDEQAEYVPSYRYQCSEHPLDCTRAMMRRFSAKKHKASKNDSKGFLRFTRDDEGMKCPHCGSAATQNTGDTSTWFYRQRSQSIYREDDSGERISSGLKISAGRSSSQSEIEEGVLRGILVMLEQPLIRIANGSPPPGFDEKHDKRVRLCADILIERFCLTCVAQKTKLAPQEFLKVRLEARELAKRPDKRSIGPAIADALERLRTEFCRTHAATWLAQLATDKEGLTTLKRVEEAFDWLTCGLEKYLGASLKDLRTDLGNGYQELLALAVSTALDLNDRQIRNEQEKIKELLVRIDSILPVFEEELRTFFLEEKAQPSKSAFRRNSKKN